MLFLFIRLAAETIFRQTNAQQGSGGRADRPFAARLFLHPAPAPDNVEGHRSSRGRQSLPRQTAFSLVPRAFTFSFRRDEKRMWGWNGGFCKQSLADRSRGILSRCTPVSRHTNTRLPAWIPALEPCRGRYFRKDRKYPKVPGGSESPGPLTAPQAPEGSLPGAVWWKFP